MTLGFNSKWSNKLLIQLPSVLIFSQLVCLISYSWLILFLSLAVCVQVSTGLPLHLLLRRDSDKMRFPKGQTILHSQLLENSAVPSAVGVFLHLLLLPLLLPTPCCLYTEEIPCKDAARRHCLYAKTSLTRNQAGWYLDLWILASITVRK